MDGDGAAACTLRFAGALTIRDVEVHHARLTAALRDHGAVTVDAADATEVDAAFLQLLIAARRSARAEGRGFALAAPAGGALLEALLRCGILAADPTARDDRFWT
ncbi:STAS domain-containing protein [Azospirillum sp. A39]|uniref:STAS domain-containing protein n=1 Tax=Azospirillum sp. A39 TaxID=3462279 RepID=UPI0040467D04